MVGKDIRGVPDADVVSRVLSGDRDAYGLLVEKYWKAAVAVGTSRLGNVHDAEEAAEEAFVAAYLNLGTLRDGRKFCAWVMRIAAQKSVGVLRRRLGARSRQQEIREDAAYPARANPGLTEEQIEQVRRAVMGLPDKMRTAVLLRYMAGLSSIEIAERLQRRPGTVRGWLRRAYKKLHRDLALVIGR